MATATITITSATNPTYGGRIDLDSSGPTYSRRTLDSNDPEATFDGATITSRSFAFFDLSTDPTSGGTITMVELLATVSSVSGTHAVDIVGGNAGGMSATDPGAGDAAIYLDCNPGSTSGATFVTAQATSAGAAAYDLGANGVSTAIAAIGDHANYLVGISLNNEAAAGSAVFDAAVGFGLRITYTPTASGLGVRRSLLLGA